MLCDFVLEDKVEFTKILKFLNDTKLQFDDKGTDCDLDRLSKQKNAKETCGTIQNDDIFIQICDYFVKCCDRCCE